MSEGNKIFCQSYGQTSDSVTGTSLNVHRQEVGQEPKGQTAIFVAFSLKTQNASHVNEILTAIFQPDIAYCPGNINETSEQSSGTGSCMPNICVRNIS